MPKELQYGTGTKGKVLQVTKETVENLAFSFSQVPAFSWATIVLLCIIMAQQYQVYQHGKQFNAMAKQLAYFERLSAFYIFTMEQKGIDVSRYVPKAGEEDASKD